LYEEVSRTFMSKGRIAKFQKLKDSYKEHLDKLVLSVVERGNKEENIKEN
jgi:hypothetical protein